MRKILTFIIKLLCGFFGIIFLFGSFGGIITCFSNQSNLILYISFILIFFVIGIILLRKALPKNKKESFVAQKSSSTEKTNISPVPTVAANGVEPNVHYPKCNCDGCPKQPDCKYGHMIYDDITKERITLADKFIMLTTLETTSFPHSFEPVNIISNMQDIYSIKTANAYSKDVIENTLSYLQEEKKLYLSFGKCGRAYFNYMKMNGPIEILKSALKNK